MDLVIVGLGRMGANMARRLHLAGHRVVAFNRSPEKTHEIMAEGLEGAFSPEEAVAALPRPRIVWLMVPAGDATESTMEEFAALLAPGDTIVDGGNSDFHDSKRRHALLAARGIRFVDAGISGGVWGLQNGYGTMVGGDGEAVAPLEPVFRSLAPEGGYIHCGPAGAGHFTKMVHNGIEYGLMQAYAEGFEDPPRLGVPPRPRGRGEGLAARHGHPLVAAGARRARLRAARRRAARTSGAGSPTPARAAGRSGRRWSSTCRRRSSRSRCWPASAAGRRSPTAPRSPPRCVSSSVATP